jgi:hypothetical protein
MNVGGALGRAVSGALKRVYSWVRIFLYWLLKKAGNSALWFRRRRLNKRQGASLAALGRRIYTLHQEGRTDWAEDSRVREVLRVVEEEERKTEELETRRHGLQDRYRERVGRLQGTPATVPAAGEHEAEPGEGADIPE